MKAWEKNIRRVTPYVPGEQPNLEHMIKLNTNENPYPPAPLVIQTLKELNGTCLRLYPDPKISDLTCCLAEYYKVNKNQVFVGVGSDDVLAMAFLTFFNSEKPILFPDITYSFYDVWAELFKIPYQKPELDKNFRIRKEDYYIENGGVVIANPNAPTSIAENLEFIEDILVHNSEVVVIIDEAYVDFGAESALSLIEKYDNLLVVQTFSKSRSMAGMRIGYAIGNERLIEVLNHVKYSYNSYTISQIGISLGIAALKEEEYFKDCIQKILNTREWTKEQLEELSFKVLNSSSNFLFVSHETIPAKELFEVLRLNHIFVRYFDKPRINNYLRITIGTEKEMKELISFLKQYVL